MPHLSSINKTVSCTLFLALFVTPAAAHNIQVSGNVAGTWHIEPNHSPKALEPARAWVALTRKGGKILPLEEANCQMAVYSQPRKESDSPVLQPTVKAIAAEKYQGIPGADIVFPNTGIYQLELSCTPKTEGNFQPFKMKYDVTVAAGVAAPPSKAETPTQRTIASATRQEWNIPAIAASVVLGLGILTIVVWRTVKR
ncbi:hypothetical protein WA1_49865 [Scytonema hofmannii PCC 7110]|uniref:Transketolase n=1 Tax=Scytonema hofmannii PCC 7110 TaxID=128403 RepID=A0A139WQX6_9CYAN|nr:hypothetical protein [Scytonema hofmannii]KYC34840.1 hypothetical protein WA1_49865 [Scytonema hofmannii PCC 7110]